ncbi:MAG: tRNA epoxyqueuosine(34) reductase QueG [Magnetospirillum sp. WYHS-4]
MGFDAVGFASSAADPEDGRRLAAYLAEGRHGGMDWMAANADRRASPQALWPEARSVVVLGLNYMPGGDPLAVLRQPDRGAVSLYARGRDYHDVMKTRLKRLARWMAERWPCEVKVFSDTAPVMEKPLAARAGLGWQGKHTNLVSRRFGSWLFLGEVFTTLELPADAPETNRCGFCDRCVKACPTGALDPHHPGRIDARRCISYLTIEHKGEIPPDLAARLGNRVFGCDECLAACPWNKFARPAREEAFLPRAELLAPRLADLIDLDDGGFREVFAGSPLKRTGRDRLVRNARAAQANGGRGDR